MINKLTEKQIAKFPEYVKKWLDIGVSTNRVDCNVAREISDYYYKNIILKPIVPVVVMSSPLYAWYAVCLFSRVGNQVRNQVWSQVEDQIEDQVRSQVRKQVEDQVRKQVGKQVEDQVWSQVRSQVRKQVEDQVGNQVRNQVGNQVEDQVRSQVRKQVEDQIEDQIEDQVRKQVWNQVWNQVWSQVRKQVEDQVRNQVGNQVEDQVRKQVGNQVEDQVRNQVGNQVEDQVRNQVGNQVEDQASNFVYPYLNGHFMSSYFSFYNFMNEVLGIKYEVQEKYEWYQKTSQVGLIYPLENICIISDRPELIKMKNGLLHSDGSPAIKYTDGFSVWVLNGIKVTKEIAETPAEKLDSKLILNEQNADIQREIIKKIGAERVLKKLNSESLDKWTDSKTGKKYELLRLKVGSIDRKYLYYEHASLGGYWYAKPVPPEINKAIEARAWIIKVIERSDIGKLKDYEIEENLPAVLS